jgi:hypothetical protein
MKHSQYVGQKVVEENRKFAVNDTVHFLEYLHRELFGYDSSTSLLFEFYFQQTLLESNFVRI